MSRKLDRKWSVQEHGVLGLKMMPRWSFAVAVSGRPTNDRSPSLPTPALIPTLVGQTDSQPPRTNLWVAWKFRRDTKYFIRYV